MSRSIYEYIVEMTKKYPGLPYIFQDAEAGAWDTKFILFNNVVDDYTQELSTRKLVQYMLEYMDAEQIEQANQLKEILTDGSLCLFVQKLNRRLKLLFEEDIFDRNKLYNLGINLATKSDNIESVKLGILIIGLFDNDFVRKILKTLGYHSIFTIYAIMAAGNFSGQSFIFNLLKNTRGYGKLAALSKLTPVNPNHQEWVFEHGIINEVVPVLAVDISFEKIDMVYFYKNLIVTEENLSAVGYLLAYAGENGNLGDYKSSRELVEKFLAKVTKHTHSFRVLAAITAIKRNMNPYWYDNKKDVGKKNGWTSNVENVVRNKCIELLKETKWIEILKNELAVPVESSSLIINTMTSLNYMPNFAALLPLLHRRMFDTDVLKFTLIDFHRNYYVDVLEYLQANLPSDVIEGEPLDLDGSDPMGKIDFSADVWLVYMLQALRKERVYKEGLFISCLTARFPDVRIEAIYALRVFKLDWSDAVIPALENAYKIEPNEKIRKRLLRLLGRTSEKHIKEQKFVDISDVKVKALPWDKSLFFTVIAGTFYRDMKVVEGRIDYGDILYLVREPDNKYDKNAIIVTTEDGYVLGYIPRNTNEIPAAMIDAGEVLYAYYRDDNDSVNEVNPSIEVMLSNRPEDNGKLIRFPGTSLL